MKSEERLSSIINKRLMEKELQKKKLIASLRGEIKEAQAQAPTKTPTKKPGQAPTKKPNKPSDPFRPPKITPAPSKARKSPDVDKEEEDGSDFSFASELDRFLKVAQTYEEGALQPVRDFWMNVPQDHPFSQHPILSEYGHNLSKEGYEYIVGRMQEGEGQVPVDVAQAGQEVQGLMQRIFALEATHEEQLVSAAKNITSEIWGIDPSMLEADINQNPSQPEQGDEGGQDEGGEENVPELTPELKKQVEKRITINTLTQGASIHAMYSVHHLVAEIINQISPELLDMYTRLSGIATHQYYIIDIPAIIQMMQSQMSNTGIGWEHIEIEEGEGEDGEAPRPKVVATGICFPVLCQELFKGVMELMSHHFETDLSEEEVRAVYYYADRLEDEPWYITVGPALWRKFIEVIPDDIDLSQMIMKINQESPENVTRIMKAVIQNPNAAREYLYGLAQELNQANQEEAPVWQDNDTHEEDEDDIEQWINENAENDNNGDDDIDQWLANLANQ